MKIDFRNEYTYNWFTKMKYLRKYSMQEMKFWFYRIVSDLFYLAAISAIVWGGVCMAGDLMKNGFDPADFFYMVIMICPVAIILAAFGLGTIQSGMNLCALPFCRRRHEFIKLYEDGVEFNYEESGGRAFFERKQYRIAREDINRVDYDEVNHIIIIYGQGTILVYADDTSGKIVCEEKCDYRFGSWDPSFEILDAFRAGDRDEIIRSLKQMADWHKDDSLIPPEEDEQIEGTEAETSAKEQERLNNSIRRYATGIVVENEVGGAVMLAAFAGMLFYLLTDMIISIRTDESVSSSVLLICMLVMFAGFAGPVRTLVLTGTGKWNRLTKEIVDSSTTTAIWPNKTARLLAEAMGRKIPKLFVKCLIAALTLFAALNISAGVSAVQTYQKYLKMRVSTVRALNEAFPEDQADPYSWEVKDGYESGVYYPVDDNRYFIVNMDRQGNITGIRYDEEGSRDKSQFSAYVNGINEKLARTGKVPGELTGPVPQKLLDEFDPLKGAKDVTETEGNVSCTLSYDINEPYDSSPDEYSLSYDIELEEEN